MYLLEFTKVWLTCHVSDSSNLNTRHSLSSTIGNPASKSWSILFVYRCEFCCFRLKYLINSIDSVSVNWRFWKPTSFKFYICTNVAQTSTWIRLNSYKQSRDYLYLWNPINSMVSCCTSQKIDRQVDSILKWKISSFAWVCYKGILNWIHRCWYQELHVYYQLIKFQCWYSAVSVLVDAIVKVQRSYLGILPLEKSFSVSES